MKLRLLLLFLFALSIQIVDAQSESKPIPLDTTYNVPRELNKIKDRYPEAIPAKDIVPKGVVAERNIVYTTLKNTPYGDRDLHLDIFRPKKDGKYPALIMVHGGGWRSGNKSLQVPMAEMIADKGYVTVAVEYQLSLEAKYPAAVYNIKAAIRWVRANAEKYNVNPDYIAISGCSSGGHLAALVATTNGMEKFEGDQGNNKFSSEVQACIDIDGVLYFLGPVSLHREKTPESPDVAWLGGYFYDIPQTYTEASPLHWVDEKTVPFLFLNSGYPRFHAGQAEMIDLMTQRDIYTELHKFDIKVHPFWLFHPWIEDAVDYVVNFMDKQFKSN